MLTPDQIAALGESAAKITDPISEYLLQDITRRIAQAGQLTSTAQYEVWRMQQLGVSQQEIKKELSKRLGLSQREIRHVMYQSAQSGYNLDIRRFPTVEAVPFAENLVLQQIVSAAAELAEADFTNLTQTLGMVDPFGKALPLQEAYRACTDFAFQQVVTGAASYTEAIRQATRNLADKGVRVIDYQSGVHGSLEAAVRRSIMGGLGLMQEQVSQVTHDQLGCNGWEITAHANSAPDHEPIQGKQYGDEAYTALNNSLRRRIGTLNCGHAAFPIILGVNRPQYTNEGLEKLRADNEKGVTVEGRHYTGYEAAQMQRKLERSIRSQKWRVMVDEAAGDTEKLARDKTRLNVLQQRYRSFTKAAGLRTQYERTEVAGFGEKTGVANAAKSGIMKEKAREAGGGGLQTVGRIDRNIFSVVFPNIRTDEVIITDERILHIKERHPGDFERYENYLKDIIKNPQYILEDKSPATAVILNEYEEDGKRFRLILRLSMPSDPADYKNSVITFLEISERKFKKYLRNKKVLYKAE